MPLTLVTAPKYEPVGLAEVKDHLRVDTADDDALIDALIPAARRFAESYTHRALVTQTWDLMLDAFPAEITVPMPPLQSVTSINYIDTAGVSQLLDAADYQVDSAGQPGRVRPAWGESWPSARGVYNAVTVRLVAGYGGAADVPEPIRQGMLMLLGHLYERREITVVGTIVSEVPMATKWLLDPYRVVRFS